MQKISIISLIFILFSLWAKAQINTSSPYSRYGAGEPEQIGFGQNKGMGGTGIGMRPQYGLNPLNPASYGSLPLQSFIFQAGMKSKRTIYETQTENHKVYDNSFNSVAVGFKANKYWAASFGLIPANSIGYQYSETKDHIFLNDTVEMTTTYKGTGGTNRIYFGNSFTYKKFALGINLSYTFGTVTNQTSVLYRDTNFLSVSKDEKNFKIKGFTYDLGVQYRDTVSGNIVICGGAVFSSKQKVNTVFTRFSTAFYQHGTYQYGDTIQNDTIAQSKLTFPMSYGAGISVTKNNLILALDFSTVLWENNQYIDATDKYMTNLQTIAFGAEYTLKPGSKNYLQNINYRIGARYSKGYLKFDDYVMTDYAFDIGFGFPVKKSSSRIDFSAEFGKKGTTENGLIRENYILFNVGFTMGDIWFIKRKFD